jgi:hypothetical protein
MARKQKRTRGSATRKPAAPDDFRAGLQAELRRQQRPAFRARLAAAERDPKWQGFKEQFKRIADEHEQAKQPKKAKKAKDTKASPSSSETWQDVAAKHASAPPSALQSIRDALTGIRSALTKDASTPQWTGTMEDFLITVVFPEHSIQPGEAVWAPETRDMDYSRRITGIVWEQYHMRVKPWTVKNAYGKRLKK